MSQALVQSRDAPHGPDFLRIVPSQVGRHVGEPELQLGVPHVQRAAIAVPAVQAGGDQRGVVAEAAVLLQPLLLL